MINLTSGKTDERDVEYYLNGLETYESFDKVVAAILQLGITLQHQLDGIYSRTASFDRLGKRFEIVFHEDVGTYAYSIVNSDGTGWLGEILTEVVNRLNSE